MLVPGRPAPEAGLEVRRLSAGGRRIRTLGPRQAATIEKTCGGARYFSLTEGSKPAVFSGKGVREPFGHDEDRKRGGIAARFWGLAHDRLRPAVGCVSGSAVRARPSLAVVRNSA